MRSKTIRRLAAPLLLLPAGLLAQPGMPLQPQATIAAADPAAAAADGQVTPADALEPIAVTARRLNQARTGIETQIGASVYTIDAAAIAAMPGGDNSLLNQVIMQAPDVVQDSFGQFHVRGEHNGLQYRLNGIILPEGINVFGQSLDPRLISSAQLITGALPAEYGLRTAAIIDLTTKSGALDPGGSVSIYGGSRGTIEPSINYGGSSGRYQYFVAADALTNDLGIESPDASPTPIHDRTKQHHEFGYLENVLDSSNRLSLILSASNSAFQIPDLHDARPSLHLNVNGQTTYPSKLLNENQREQTEFAIVSWQHSAASVDLQTSLTVRQSTLQFTPDALGSLLYNGISQSAYKRNRAYDWQTESAYDLAADHTLRAGLFIQTDTSTSLTSSQVLALDPADGQQISTSPATIVDNDNETEHIESLYVQDEWRWTPALTVNYGLRFDTVAAYIRATQLSPRLNMVWKATPATTVHAGYARYMSPPPFELVGSETVSKFIGTTAAPAVTEADTPKAERANYFDIGLLQAVSRELNLGLDSYFKRSSNLIDEGQFGAPIILTPFNYAAGRQYGVEATANYTADTLSVYANLAWQTAVGRQWTSAQFNFTAADIAYVADHYIPLDHEQKLTASGGAAYHRGDNRVSADFLLGSGLRAQQAAPNGSAIPNGTRLPYYTQVNAGASHRFRLAGAGTLTARLDIVNLFDRQYEIRNGSGVGVGAPQYGPRRELFIGLSKSL